MPVLQHAQASYNHRLSSNFALPRTQEQPAHSTSIEQAIANLKDAFHSCLGNQSDQINRPATSGVSELVALASMNYFRFSRPISRDDHLFVAMGPRWYYKLELVAKLAAAVQQFAIAQSLNPDDDRLRSRWSESFSIAFMAECLSRAVGGQRPSEAWVAGMVVTVLGCSEACRAIACKPPRSIAAISHLDAREPILTLANVERMTRVLELGKGFSISRAAIRMYGSSPWPQVAAACYLELAARRNFWVAELAMELERTPLSAPIQRALLLRSHEIAKMSREIALIGWNAAAKTGSVMPVRGMG